MKMSDNGAKNTVLVPLHARYLKYELFNGAGHTNQSRIAQEIGCSEGVLSLWMSGKRGVSRHNQNLIARFLFGKVCIDEDRQESRKAYLQFEGNFVSAFSFLKRCQNNEDSIENNPPERARLFLIAIKRLTPNEKLIVQDTPERAVLQSNLFSAQSASSQDTVNANAFQYSQIEQRARDIHRAELLAFTPQINEFLMYLGEFRDIVDSLRCDPKSIVAASMLQSRIDDFSVDSSGDLHIQMQRYFGYYMAKVLLLLRALQMLGNERVYGFNSKDSDGPETGQIVFEGEAEFRQYLSHELTTGLELINEVINFVQNSLRERPDMMLLQQHNVDKIDQITQWARKIGKDSRGSENLFEHI